MGNIWMHPPRTFRRMSLLALCALTMRGQTADTGGIAGTVSDPSGALVPRAAVIVTSEDTGEKRDLTTDGEGNFSIQFLAPGNYDLTVGAPGFEPLTLKSVRVQITEVSRVQIQLALRGKKEQIAISSKPPLLQTENATLGRVIDRNTIEELPLVNRNFTEILGLTAGTNTDIVDATQLGAGSQEIRANGARSGDNNFMLNGVDANSYSSNITELTPFGGAGIAIPAPDTIQEFKVQTSLYDAQYGRGGGANVDIETRSGTADLHGNVYYFGRNEVLDANNFFANATGVPRGEFRRSQLGGTLGGPLPWSKKRAFFFTSYQATGDVNAASLSSSVRSLSLPPIPQVRTPASLGAVFGGQTGAFGGVAVAPDGSNINPVALKLLNAKNSDGAFVIPSPQTSGSGVNYTAVLPGHYNEDQFNTNFDVNLGTADHLSAKFFFSNSNQDVPFFGATVPGFPVLRSFWNRNLSTSEIHALSAQTINQFRFGFSRLAGQSVAGGTLTDQDVGINRFSEPQERIIPQIQVLGGFQLGNSANDQGDKTASNNFYISDAISLSRGKHDLRLGTEIFRNQFNHRSDYSAGILTVLSFPDFLLGLPAGPAGAGGNGTSLSSIFFSGAIVGSSVVGERASAGQLFALDDWKVTRTLTISLGVRVEVNGQQSEAHGRESNFFPQFYAPPPAGGFGDPISSGFVLPDNFHGYALAGFPRANSTLLNHPVQKHPEPRIGFAWQPFSSKDLVLRGGYGIYANRTSFAGNGLVLALNPPFAYDASLTGGANAAASLQNPFPSLPPTSSFPNFVANMLPGPPFTGNRFPLAATITDPDFKESTVQHVGLDVQYQYKSYVFSLAYAGAKGTHLAVGRSDNQPARASPSNPVHGLTTNSVANAAERVPFVGLSPLIFRLESSGNSIYNSLQATLKKDMSHGLQFLAAYTFSKSIDDAGDSLGAAFGGGFGIPILGQLAYNDQNDVAAQRGVSDFDRTHRLVISGTWSVPGPDHAASAAIRKLGDGWSISGIATLQSGLPFSIMDSAAGTLYGPATLYTTGSLAPGATLADAGRSGGVSSRVNEFFNTRAFVPAPFVPDGGLIDGKYPVSGGGGTVFGNLGRNILRGPDQQDFDIAAIKTTPLTDRVKLIFRWEIFNLMNRSNFANPSNDVSTPSTFGTISALTVNPRIMQYALKLEF
jgi:Carboxypeptidase regulatory-like domain/TonB-dependent Receptor Plug Domain